MSVRRISAAIWSLALVVRLTLMFGFHRQDPGRPEPVFIAVALASRGAFADPYPTPTGSTAHAAPLYPWMLAPMYVIWGDTPAADLARMIFSTAGAAFEYGLLPLVAESLGMPVSAGVVAGTAGAIFPMHYWTECMGGFEATWVALFLELTVMLFGRFMTRPSFTARSGLWAGVWCGLGMLLAPVLLLPLAGWFTVAWWRFRWRVIRPAAILSLTALAVAAPWIVRNYMQFGGWFLVRDNFGLELHMSNNDDARADLEQNIETPFFFREHPFKSPAAAARLRDEGELRFEREHMAGARRWIRAHPRKFLRLTLDRAENFWFPILSHPLHQYAVWTLTVWAWVALLYLCRTNPFAAAVLGSLLLTFPLVYYFIENYVRYQHPVYWALLLLASAPVAAIARMPSILRHRVEFVSRVRAVARALVK